MTDQNLTFMSFFFNCTELLVHVQGSRQIEVVERSVGFFLFQKTVVVTTCMWNKIIENGVWEPGREDRLRGDNKLGFFFKLTIRNWLISYEIWDQKKTLIELFLAKETLRQNNSNGCPFYY